MVNHNIAIEFLKKKIQYLRNEIEFSKEKQKSNIQEINDLEGSLIALKRIINEPLKIKNNTNRLKVIKNNKEIKINIIIKEDKKYAVVPLEILPKIIIF